MALDSRSKRASSVGLGLLFVLAPPSPDGALAQGDRQHIAASYAGVLAAAPVLGSSDLVQVAVAIRRSVTAASKFTRTINLTVER